ncbi:MAG: pknB 10, partial [Planctomycetaceae bacterium]|nr:pknB 10 [Planctomycetaceae bacterium]
MPVDPRVQDLLEKLMESGRTVEEECVDCPELLTQVQERWEWLRACDARLDAMFPLPESKSLVRTSTFLRAAVHLPTIPGYEIQQVLGRGGMGIIYKARHVRLNREVAVKMLLAGVNATEKYCDRFLREAEAVASLKHPNIVQIYDMGERDGQLYFTMEFVEGGNLAQKLADMPLPPREACCLLATLATAVEAAHQSQIVHRDLKPANILLTADGTPKISDFGLARRLDDDSGLTWIGAAVGTPGYMAPEQAEAKPFKLGPSVDIYALGAILYELLTGRPPFKGETAAETVRQLISQAPVPPSRLNQQISRDLETICLKCLHKEPQRRYVSAAALAADIHCWLAGEAIAARPDGRLRKWTRRIFRRPGYAMAAAIGLLLSLELVSDGRWRSFNRT